MPRGRKKQKTVTEELALIDEKIRDAEQTLKDLKQEKKVLELKLKEERLGEIENLLNEKGMSVEELKQLIDEK